MGLFLDKIGLPGELGTLEALLVAIVSLNQTGRFSRSEVGGKGAHLCELIHLGLPVPPTWVVPVSTFIKAARHNAGESDPNKWSLPMEWLEAWTRVAAELGVPMAIRSSAPKEDGQDTSYAGQFETVLNVEAENVVSAIRTCWASVSRATENGYGRQDEAEAPGMAVVIQPMVESVVSGVLFTINPMNGSWREMSVEAVWGQCEGLVSGELSPHWYLIRRPRGRLARIRMSVIQEQIHPIDVQFIPGASGQLERAKVPKRKRNKSTMRPAELFRLCRLGIKIERHFACPQDVEWAKTASGELVILQARPITSQANPRQREDVVWTRRFLGERWPERATPMGWSLTAPLLEYFIAYPKTQQQLLGGGPALRRMQGRPYLNASVFPHLAFKLPGMPAPHFILELMPPDEVEIWRRKFAVMPDLAVYRSILSTTIQERRWKRFRWNPLTNHRVWEAFELEFRAATSEWSRTPESVQDALELVVEQQDWMKKYVGIHVCSLLFANIWDQVLEGILASSRPERARALHRALATCPDGNRTLACNQALYDLAHVLGDEGIQAVEQGVALSAGHDAALREFLSLFGNRSEAGWEVFSVRWREDPTQLAPYLRSALQSTAPSLVAERQLAAYRSAEAELKTLYRGPRRWMVAEIIELVRTYLLLRENQRFLFEDLIWSLKQTLLWLGEHGVQSGWLSEAGDVQFLEWSDLRDAVLGQQTSEAILDLVKSKRAEWHALEHQQMPDFIRGDEPLQLPKDARRLQGLGISSGRVRGTVRILQGPSEAGRLQRGDILVARSVDPGWTPLFSTAGGLILELGGRLSHGAVVAREYQLPGVVQIRNATQSLRDGQQVIVDGRQGLVWIESEA